VDERGNISIARSSRGDEAQIPVSSQSEPGHPGCHARPDGANYLPRLERVFYQGDAVVHWELNISHRRTGWLNDAFHAMFREVLLHTAVREGLFCPTYCLMPDHMHLVWMGLKSESDQLNGMSFLRRHLAPALVPFRFQHQPFDHVLRDDERRRNAFAAICCYILGNPVEAKLAPVPEEWRYAGAVVPGYPTLHPLAKGFWPLFWKLYGQAHEPAASHRKLPPRAEEPR
jgi:REP element-mobilizing transposase RayT